MLSVQQCKCLELMVSGSLTQKGIAKQIKVSEQTICNWKKDTEFMSEYKRQLNIFIQSMAAKAFRTHTSLLNSKSAMVKYLAAKDILDRAGFKPDDKLTLNGGLTIIRGEADIPD